MFTDRRSFLRTSVPRQRGLHPRFFRLVDHARFIRDCFDLVARPAQKRLHRNALLPRRPIVSRRPPGLLSPRSKSRCRHHVCRPGRPWLRRHLRPPQAGTVLRASSRVCRTLATPRARFAGLSHNPWSVIRSASDEDARRISTIISCSTRVVIPTPICVSKTDGGFACPFREPRVTGRVGANTTTLIADSSPSAIEHSRWKPCSFKMASAS